MDASRAAPEPSRRSAAAPYRPGRYAPDDPPRGPPPLPPPLAPLNMSEVEALGTLPLRARLLADAIGVGGHRSRRKGASVEFADYRDYQPGDDLRRVDWRLFGRTDRLQVRDAHEETPLRVQLLLDVSASMSFSSRPGLMTKLDVSRTVLAAIALLTQRQRDACGVALLGDEVLHYAPPSASPSRLRGVWGALETPSLARKSALAQTLGQVAEIAPARCLFVLASDFYEEPADLAGIAGRLRFERHDLLALHVMDPVEEDFTFNEPAHFLDLETENCLQLDPAAAARHYRAAFAAHRGALDDTFRTHGFDYVPLRSDASPLSALAAYLSRRAGKA